MRIAYLSNDEVNRDLVARWADRRDITLVLLDREPIPADTSLDALLFDLDYLSSERREEVLASMLYRDSICLSAAHSYNLDIAQEESLHTCGVLVTHRLTEDFFDRLCRTIRLRTFTPQAMAS